MFYKTTDMQALKERACTIFTYTHDNKYFKGIVKNTLGAHIDLYLSHNKITVFVDKYTILKIADQETDIRLPDGRYWQD